ncbi:MAG TPA: hypothetical protein VJ242_02995 [Patescibacteria group bacterium]|nr:hypothetical protein [Patescibacteria group bacterium]
MKDLKQFSKPGLWLAVIVKNKTIKVISAEKSPDKALKKAKDKGFKQVSMMRSAHRYGSWSTWI